ncbi:MAG: hypothetical protein AAFY69_14065 [Pseudomonadota bacterium]
MRDLRFAQLWRVGGFGLLIFMVVALLSPGGNQVLPPGNFDKAAHIIGFFGATMWFAGVYQRSRWLHVAAGMMLFGVLTELAQGLLTRSRSADPMDFVADAGGVLLALAVARLGFEHWARWAERLLVRS